MSCSRLVPLLLCLLLPLQGLAQPRSPADAPLSPMTPPPLVPASGEPEEAAPDEVPRGEIIPNDGDSVRGSDSRSVRVPVGILLGTVGGAVGAIPGTVLMASAICFDGCSGEDEAVYVGFVLAIAGVITGTAATVNWMGDVMDGQGSFWPAALGALLGTLGGGIAGAAVAAVAGLAGLIPVILGPAVGAVIGYELSHSGAVEAAAGGVASRPRLVPLVTVSPRGGLIGGLAGTF
jgi:hypothetical protein